jgi:hypothetical protein
MLPLLGPIGLVLLVSEGPLRRRVEEKYRSRRCKKAYNEFHPNKSQTSDLIVYREHCDESIAMQYP